MRVGREREDGGWDRGQGGRERKWTTEKGREGAGGWEEKGNGRGEEGSKGMGGERILLGWKSREVTFLTQR